MVCRTLGGVFFSWVQSPLGDEPLSLCLGLGVAHALRSQFPISRGPCGSDTSPIILVGVLGDFHFQALRIYTREEKLLHGYYMYEGTVQPAGGTFPAGLSGRRAQGTLLQQAWS